MSGHDDHGHDAPKGGLIEVSPPAKLWRNLMFIVLGVMVVLNFFIHPHHPHFEAEAYPLFWVAFGLVVALVLARVAKGAAHTFLGKREDFYTGKDD